MKRTLISIAASLGCLLVPSTAVFAQSSGYVYNIPFSFNVQGVEMAAGRYNAITLNQSIGELRGPGGSVMFQKPGQLNAKPRAAHLTFYKHGDAYFLREVWDESGVGSKVPEGVQERKLEMTEQQARIQPRTVLLAASR